MCWSSREEGARQASGRWRIKLGTGMGQSEQENITSCEEYGQCWELEDVLEQLEQRARHEKEKQQHEKWFRIQKN